MKFGSTEPNKSMHANCYAAFNRNWLGLWRRVSVERDFAGPQSRDFKRYTAEATTQANILGGISRLIEFSGYLLRTLSQALR